MQLEIYKNIRDYVWKTLLNGKADRLPLDLFSLCRNLRIPLYSFTYGLEANLLTKEMIESKNKEKEVAFTLTLANKKIIFYNDIYHPNTRVRYGIAHEIGHIILKHDYKIKMMSTKDRETEANKFAILLLSPAIVLHCCRKTKAKDIMLLCDISLKSAKIRADKIKIYEQLNKYDTTLLEREVHIAFQNFIDDYNKN